RAGQSTFSSGASFGRAPRRYERQVSAAPSARSSEQPDEAPVDVMPPRWVSWLRAARAPCRSGLQVLLQKRDRSRPRELRCGFVVARRGVAVGAVLGAWIHVHLVLDD